MASRMGPLARPRGSSRKNEHVNCKIVYFLESFDRRFVLRLRSTALFIPAIPIHVNVPNSSSTAAAHQSRKARLIALSSSPLTLFGRRRSEMGASAAIEPRGVDAFQEVPSILPEFDDPLDNIKKDVDEGLMKGAKFYTKLILVPGESKPYRIAVQLLSLSPVTDDCLWTKPGTVSKPPANVLFAHATGMPKLSYLAMLKRMLVKAGPSRVAVAMTLDARNAGDSCLANGPFPDAPLDWRVAARDYISLIDHLGLNPSQSGRPLIASGHSHGGGVLLMAEMIRPGLFSGYVGVEPISVAQFTLDKQKEMADKGIKEENRVDLAVGARRRKNNFASKQAAYDASKDKPFFKRWSREALWAYFQDGLTPDEKGGVKLKTPGIAEANTFEGSGTTAWGFSRLPTLRIPRVHIISGADSEQLYFWAPGPDTPPPTSWHIHAQYKKHYDGILLHGVRQYAKDIAIARYVPGAVHEIVEGGGHMIPQDLPWEIARRLGKMVWDVTEDVEGWKRDAWKGEEAEAKL